MWKDKVKIMKSLTDMLSKKREKITWTKEAEEAFQKAKEMCMEDTLLHYPDLNEKFVIFTDASDYAMGATGTQERKVVFYWSK